MHGSTSNLDWLSSVRPLLELDWWQHRDEPCASPRASDIGIGQLTYQPAELRLFARQKVKKAASPWRTTGVGARPSVAILPERIPNGTGRSTSFHSWYPVDAQFYFQSVHNAQAANAAA
jgi:hypothetical protein